jgi:hypothetical protein
MDSQIDKLPDTFCIFILTHGRPDNIKTLKTLAKGKYSGRLYFVVDNEDKMADKYIANFGVDKVLIFDKKKMADACDEGNNFDERRTITMARNACFELAPTVGVTHFIELDDDYTCWQLRYLSECGTKLRGKNININKALNLYLDFYQKSGATSLAFSQGGDFIGGAGGEYVKKCFPLIRKAMNSFICSTERPFKFIGAMNEDVNTYTTLGSRGKLFFTVMHLSITQTATQSQKGGITEMYLRYGTYCKAFTTVMMMPSSVKVATMQSNNPRLHHSIDWQTTVPKIISEDHKKK